MDMRFFDKRVDGVENISWCGFFGTLKLYAQDDGIIF